MAAQSWSCRPQFSIGATVQIDDRSALGHCRAPSYLRGLTGEVCHVHGAFRDPEKLAYHQPGLPPQTLYKIRISQTSIWPEYRGPESDTLEVDVYENWLKPAV
ncbi:MAG: SH3-like domain-containing protein [Pseudomonadota bacterium]